jgi:hypothetical protein
MLNFRTLLVSLILIVSSYSIHLKASEHKKLEQLVENLQLVGEFDFSVWIWDVYHIELLTQDGKYQPVQFPLMLALEYKRSISSDDLIEETDNQWKRFALDKEQSKAWLEQLSHIWPDVSKGDKISFYVDAEFNTHFYLNQKFIGAIKGEAFATAFSQIWLAPNGPYPEMTATLIGKTPPS